MTRMTGPDCAVMCNLINTHTNGGGAGTRTWVEVNEGTQDENKDMSGAGARTGTGTGVETRGRTQDEDGDGSGDGNESTSGDGNGDESGNGDGHEDGIGEGGGETKKRKKPHKSCRHDVGNGRHLGGKRKQRREEGVGSVAADEDNLEKSKEARGEAQGTQDLSVQVERVCPLCLV